MKLTIIETGHVPQSLRGRFKSYPEMFSAMFARHGEGIEVKFVPILEGAPLPEVDQLEAVLITGSPAGVYDDYPWMNPLRQFIGRVHDRRIKMVGVCFGHQIIADALGGVVRKSDKGWGLGRHVYEVLPARPHFVPEATQLAVACSHQDQVIEPPASARVILRSDFAPNAGLLYGTGTILTVQPHPEFEDDYATALIDLRKGLVDEETLNAAHASMQIKSDSAHLARAIGRYLAA